MHHDINKSPFGWGTGLSELSTANSGITGSRLSRCGFCNYLSCTSQTVLDRPCVLDRPWPSFDRPCSALFIPVRPPVGTAKTGLTVIYLFFAGNPLVRLAVSLSLNHLGQNLEPELSPKARCILPTIPPSCPLSDLFLSDPTSSIPFLQALQVEGKSLRKC